MHTALQLRLAVLYPLFDLLAKRAVGRGGGNSRRAASREHRGLDQDADLALDARSHGQRLNPRAMMSSCSRCS